MIKENVVKMLNEIKRLTDEDWDAFMEAFLIYETNADETDPDTYDCAATTLCRYCNADNVDFLSKEMIEVMDWGVAKEADEDE